MGSLQGIHGGARGHLAEIMRSDALMSRTSFSRKHGRIATAKLGVIFFAAPLGAMAPR